ncbi:MAG: ABC transporter substrate-binding protein [Chloroflexota bacterium]
MRGRLLTLIVSLLMLVGFGASAQESGLGVIRLGADVDTRDLTTTLIPVEPQTGQIRSDVLGEAALFRAWEATDDGQVIFTLDDSHTWPDGTPFSITDAQAAVDNALPSLRQGGATFRAAPLSTTELLVASSYPTCDLLERFVGVFVLPASIVAPGAADNVVPFLGRIFETDNERLTAWAALQQQYSDEALRELDRLPVTTRYIAQPTFDREATRITRAASTQAIELIPTQTRAAGVLAGDRTIMADVSALLVSDFDRGGAQVRHFPEGKAFLLALAVRNPAQLADRIPLDETAAHYAFGDERVRQAIQLAVDTAVMVDGPYQGYASPLNSLAAPNLWFEPASRSSVAFDPVQAIQLLEDAGWSDADGDGVRECYGCAFAPRGTQLRLGMGVSDFALGELVVSQLRRIGVSVTVTGGEITPGLDMALVSHTPSYPFGAASAERYFARFTADASTSLARVTGYVNADAVAAVDAAGSLACDAYDERAGHYTDATNALLADTVYIPLVAPHTVYAAVPGLVGFDPLPHRPLWNVEDWTVLR